MGGDNDKKVINKKVIKIGGVMKRE